VLVLRYFDDLSIAATAEAMGCTEGTVKSQAARGLANLRAAMTAAADGKVAS
jgi:DNA-directed RNA polymerase specialized sigma24 family protein